MKAPANQPPPATSASQNRQHGAPHPAAGGEPSGINSKYLRLQDLRRMKNMFFSSRRIVEGQYAGRHASPMRGHSVEFNDFRQYMPGDEIADIDWKVYGRTDKLFIKLFEHQSDMTVNLLVDSSASMAYAGIRGASDGHSPPAWRSRDGYSKYDHACMMAAAIAFLTTKQQDKVSFGLARDGLRDFQRPYGSFKHFAGVLRTMEASRPTGKAHLGDSLRKMAEMIGRRGLLIVFSDLLDSPQEVFDALSIFTHRGSEVIVFHVLHADELKLPELHEAVFIDSEDHRRVSMNVHDVRSAYAKKLDNFLTTWSSACRGRGIDYKLVSTATNYSEALQEYLFQRASMI